MMALSQSILGGFVLGTEVMSGSCSFKAFLFLLSCISQCSTSKC